VDLHIPPTMRTLGITKFVQDGYQSSPQMSKKWACMEMHMQFLQQYCEGEAFLQQIVTGDETWMHHY
jgi:hypothetical protein